MGNEGIKGIINKIREKTREYRLRRELDEIERIYTAQPTQHSKTLFSKKKTREKTGWGDLDEYFKDEYFKSRK